MSLNDLQESGYYVETAWPSETIRPDGRRNRRLISPWTEGRMKCVGNGERVNDKKKSMWNPSSQRVDRPVQLCTPAPSPNKPHPPPAGTRDPEPYTSTHIFQVGSSPNVSFSLYTFSTSSVTMKYLAAYLLLTIGGN